MRYLYALTVALLLQPGWHTAAATESTECRAVAADDTHDVPGDEPLPIRPGAPVLTSGAVPHVQLGVTSDTTLNGMLYEKAFSLPGVTEKPTIVSLPGAMGMWLGDDVPVVFPKAIVSGREFAHIHTDGSLHAPLPLKRAMEVQKKGWGERHPWADRFDGWEGLVMLYSATSQTELDTLVQLVTESYNHVTGQAIPIPCD